MQIEQPLQSKRIQLRCLSEKDVTDSYVSWLNNIEVNQFLEVRLEKHSRDSVKAFLQSVNASNDTLILGMFIEEGQKHIGNIKIGPINIHHKRAEIGLLIGDRNEWGRGYASEAIALLTNFGFQTLGLKKITAGCYSENKRSVKAFLKAGYKVEACLPSHWITNKGPQDEILVGLTAEQYSENSKTRLVRKFGHVRRLVLIGGGDLMAYTAQAAHELGYEVVVIMAPRHAEETLPLSGIKIRAALGASEAKVLVVENINEARNVDQWTGPEVLALCFGPAWIFSSKVIGAFGAGMINFNGIPIPHYLGGAHYTWQILNGNKQGGCFLQEITNQLDQGDILKAEKFVLPSHVSTPRDYFAANHEIGRRFIRQTLEEFQANKEFSLVPFSKVNSMRLYFPRLLTKDNGWIDWNWSGREIALFCQAFDEPYQGAATYIKGNEVRLKQVVQADSEMGADSFHSYASGMIVRKLNGKIWVAATDGLLQVKYVGNPFGNNILAEIKEGDRFQTPMEILNQARSFRPAAKDLNTTN